MTKIDIAALVGKLSSQIGDDIQVIFNHESLFKQSRAALIAQDSELRRLREALACMLDNYGPPPSVAHLAKYAPSHPISLARAALGEKP